MDLVKFPTQGGLDSCENISKLIIKWCESKNIPINKLTYQGKFSGLLIEIEGTKSGPTICLNACLDTSPVDDFESWMFDPFTPTIVKNWLYGRGTADSKTAISIFLHIAQIYSITTFAGTLHILFDAEEHTGNFYGIKSYAKRYPNIDGMYLGYPGRDKICVGSRGFLRFKIIFKGRSGHSGESIPLGKNPIDLLGLFIKKVNSIDVAKYYDPEMHKYPKFTITSVHSGNSFTSTPDKCETLIDIRLTKSFQANQAREIIQQILKSIETKFSCNDSTLLKELESWPAYKIPDHHFLVYSLQNASFQIDGRHLNLTVSGPSNIGNFMSTFDIPVVSGFGVEYKNLHSINERINLKTIWGCYSIYLLALDNMFKRNKIRRQRKLLHA